MSPATKETKEEHEMEYYCFEIADDGAAILIAAGEATSSDEARYTIGGWLQPFYGYCVPMGAELKLYERNALAYLGIHQPNTLEGHTLASRICPPRGAPPIIS